MNRDHSGLAVPHDPPSLQGSGMSIGQAGVRLTSPFGFELHIPLQQEGAGQWEKSE